MAKLIMDAPLSHKEAARLRIELYSGIYKGEDLQYAVSRLADYDEAQAIEADDFRRREAAFAAQSNQKALGIRQISIVAAISAIISIIFICIDVAISSLPLIIH